PHELDGRGARAAVRAGGPRRAPDPADPRPRIRRRRHGRPPRRIVRGRAADRGRRGGGRGVHREDRRDGRLDPRDPFHATGDPGRRVPVPDGDRGEGPYRGRRQRLRRRGAAGVEPLPRRSGRRGGARPAARRPARAARPAHAGLADRVGATFGLMEAEFIKTFQPIEGMIVAVDGKRLYLDLTGKDVRVGQEFTVFRKGEVFRHPLTGRPLGRYEDVLGYAQVRRVEPKFAEGDFIP